MAHRRKILFVILDGLGDLPHPALEGRTPLEAAETPVLDQLVAQGVCGLVDPLAPGVVVETHAGTAPLMGLDPARLATLARGPIEAAGAGMELASGDVALRGNFATVVRDGDEFEICDRRAGRIREGTEQLAQALSDIGPIDGVRVVVTPQKQHRIVVHLSGSGLGSEITDSDPGTAGIPQRVRRVAAKAPGDVDSERTATALNQFLARAHEVLAAHPLNREREAQGQPPANGLLTRGAGTVQPVDGLIAGLGLRGALVAGDRAVLGLGRLLGFTPICQPGFTGLVDSDVQAKVAAAREALENHDIVWLHYKGTDIASHDMQPLIKRDCIERVDAALRPFVGQDIVIAVTADHTTNSATGSHTAHPVPALLRAPEGQRDAVTAFDEAVCRDGDLGRMRSAAFFRCVLDAAGVVPPVVDPVC